MPTYTWTPLAHPTKYHVIIDGHVAIPKGTTGVDVAFHQSSKTWTNKRTGKIEKQNVYRWNGVIYNA